MNQVAQLIQDAHQSVRDEMRDRYHKFRAALVAKYGEQCLACGAITDLQIDHVIPVHQHGPSELWNLQLLCAPCNNAKGNTTRDYRAGRELSPVAPATTVDLGDVEREARRLLFLLDKCDLSVRERHNVDALRRKIQRGGRIGIYEMSKICATAHRFRLISEDDLARVRVAARAAFDEAFLGGILAEMEIEKERKERRKAKKVVKVAVQQAELTEKILN